MKKLTTLISLVISLNLQAQFYIGSGTHLTIAGDVSISDTVINQGNVHIYNNASFWYKNETGNGTYNSYYKFDAKKRYLVSSPLSNVSTRIFNRELSKLADNIWKYDAGWKLIQDSIVLQAGLGYLTASNIYKTVQMSGGLNDTVSIRFSNGLNVIGNPYLCNLDTAKFNLLTKNTPGSFIHGRGLFFTNDNPVFDVEFTKADRIKPSNPVIDVNDSVISFNGYVEVNSTNKGFLMPRLNVDSIKYVENGMIAIDTFYSSILDTTQMQMSIAFYSDNKWNRINTRVHYVDYDSITVNDSIIETVDLRTFRWIEVWYRNADGSETMAGFSEIRDTKVVIPDKGYLDLAINERLIIVATEEKKNIRIYIY